jgi:hypothetical protein
MFDDVGIKMKITLLAESLSIILEEVVTRKFCSLEARKEVSITKHTFI